MIGFRGAAVGLAGFGRLDFVERRRVDRGGGNRRKNNMAKVSRAGKIPLVTCMVRVWSKSNATETAFENDLDNFWNEAQEAINKAIKNTLSARGYKVKATEQTPPFRGLEIWV